MTGLLVVVGVLAMASAFGFYRQRTQGRVVDRPKVTTMHVLSGDDLGRPLGGHATLVQFSTAFCAPCRATRSILADVAGVVPGVAFIEVDAESNLDLVRRLKVTRTPTVLIVDGRGRVVNRAVGQPRKADVLAALAPALG